MEALQKAAASSEVDLSSLFPSTAASSSSTAHDLPVLLESATTTDAVGSSSLAYATPTGQAQAQAAALALQNAAASAGGVKPKAKRAPKREGDHDHEAEGGGQSNKRARASRIQNCNSCRAKKMRCDRLDPCTNCSVRNFECVWEVAPPTPIGTPAELRANELTITQLRAEVQSLSYKLGLTPHQLEALKSEADTLLGIDPSTVPRQPAPAAPAAPPVSSSSSSSSTAIGNPESHKAKHAAAVASRGAEAKPPHDLKPSAATASPYELPILIPKGDIQVDVTPHLSTLNAATTTAAAGVKDEDLRQWFVGNDDLEV